MSALERLDAIDARVTATTGSPWATDRPRLVRARRLTGPRTVAATDLPDDAAFIAAARQDVPVMATALRALVALHEREDLGPYGSVCSHCRSAYGESVVFPCATVRIIETELAR